MNDTMEEDTESLEVPQSPQPRQRRDICTMVRDEGRFVGVLAPMVRYSKMPFRVCCHRWGCDVAYSPMLVADSFIRCAKARDRDLTTSPCLCLSLSLSVSFVVFTENKQHQKQTEETDHLWCSLR